MPELPEVETVRRGLEAAMLGRRFVKIELRRPDLRFPLPADFVQRLTGARVDRLRRRAKYLLADLSNGDILVMHLGMSGRFTVGFPKADTRARRALAAGGDVLGGYDDEAGADPRHDHVVFHMSGGAVITYNDPRRFGFMLIVRGGDLDRHPLFRSLGAEPLGDAFDARYLGEMAEGRKLSLKAFLMDQRVVAGLGNIYVCEALFRAGLSPKRLARCLAGASGAARERRARLIAAVRAVLGEAIEAGGSTLRDYRKSDGASGAFQHAHAVYDRDGEPCLTPGCPGTVRRLVQQGRATFYCARCQR